MSEKVLFVDDDTHILEACKRQLRRHFEVSTAPGGEAGLDLMERCGPFAVIVSDMRMPGMDGARFLAEARKRAPDSVRILLTGQADVESAIAVVNEGGIFRFLTKPCPPASLLTTLHEAIKQYQLITAERTLLEKTLHGSVKVLTEVLALVNPVAFGRAARLKRYAHHITVRLDLPDAWQVEIAAMLSQLGCVTLPSDSLEKMYAGQPLSPDEQKMLASHPAVGADLLRRIPRLEAVAAMIARQHEPDQNQDDLQDPQLQEVVRLGAHILKIILDFDQLVTRGVPHPAAMAELRKRPDPHGIVAALQDIPPIEDDTIVQTVTVRQLCSGMILDEDIRTKSGALVIAKGHEVTYVLIERLLGFANRVEIVEPFRVLVPRQKYG